MPRLLAVIHADGCTGCEACLEICPAACIYKVQGEGRPGPGSFCEVDLDRCIGCKQCAQLCPWNAAAMVDTPDVARRVAMKGGPSWYIDEAWDAIVDRAQRNVEGFLAKKRK
ncbi:indolepyruvate ferredoxin oxidoreductase subunit alpha [Paludisphaera mucosa]|uniref:4Fe-4S dicluster domain-containing protein n=1 Tax=Paludisphaera mucosa TaxID=3030827 RepID=A0ABT6F718_9BACT|nr:4Fe-4S dicluster domain-containing protein [Paludisphaera mucosa]